MKYPETIQNLIECYEKYPSIGKKTAERLALASLNLDEEVIDLFALSFKNIKEKIKRCSLCNNITENDICDICSNKDRNKDLLCIVESPKDIILIEKNNIFDGYYYVISELINPSNGFENFNTNFSEIINLLKTNGTKEVIIAIKPTIEGETTSMYISKLLEREQVVVSRIALGIPIGAEIDYVDSLTLEMALENRKVINSN